jgi:hypothetical protein
MKIKEIQHNRRINRDERKMEQVLNDFTNRLEKRRSPLMNISNLLARNEIIQELPTQYNW